MTTDHLVVHPVKHRLSELIQKQWSLQPPRIKSCDTGGKQAKTTIMFFGRNRSQNRALELKISASGSKLRCASFLFFPSARKFPEMFDLANHSCFFGQKMVLASKLVHIQVPELKIGPSDTESQNLPNGLVGFPKKQYFRPKTGPKNLDPIFVYITTFYSRGLQFSGCWHCPLGC